MRSQLAEPASNSLKIQNHRSLTIFRWSRFNRDSILDCVFFCVCFFFKVLLIHWEQNSVNWRHRLMEDL